MSQPLVFVSVDSASGPDAPSPPSLTYVLAACGVIAIFLLGLFFGSKRTVRTKCTFIPENPNDPSRTTKRNGPYGIEGAAPPQCDGHMGNDFGSQTSLEFAQPDRKKFKVNVFLTSSYLGEIFLP